ncbi:peptidoglycan editing factor PgeF [Streptosporangium roseum]|uniref:peptidoglycan editing factor PgeF n=1 Tax=Streptosporangium roseum TaxID=2001 RepID=UPI003333DC1E
MLRIGDVRMAFTDRNSRVSIPPDEVERLGPQAEEVVRQGREQVATGFGLSPERVVYMRQVHGARVRYVTGPLGDTPPALDGVCTDQPGLGLAVLVADCAPVLIADPEAGVVGTAHAGRAGMSTGVIASLVAAMTGRHARPARMVALIGPAICGLCYEVSAGLRDNMVTLIPEAFSVSRWGTPGLDLRAAVTAQLHGLGIDDVLHDERCTMESPELYSYRREGPTGDFAGYVWREDPNCPTGSGDAV